MRSGSAAGLGGERARVFDVLGGSVAMRGLSIRYGRPHPREPGAGVAVAPGATLELSDCLLAHNETDGSGGGLYAGPLVVDLEVLVMSPDLEESLGVPIVLDVLPPTGPAIFQGAFESGDLVAWSGSAGG